MVVTTIKKTYVYHCYGGSHSSVTAAAIHVGLLPPDSVPAKGRLLSLPYYDTQKAEDHGVLQFVGTDGEGNLVFAVGLETAAKEAIPALKNIFAIAGASTGPVRFVDTMPAVNWLMKLGGICSRVFGIKGIGRPLVVLGTRLAFGDIRQLVQKVVEKG